jgi:tripartite-type tricarboxylate transporter receptor subunit TctC
MQRKSDDAAEARLAPVALDRRQPGAGHDLFKKVRETPDWQKPMSDGAFNQTFRTGEEFAKWVSNAKTLHEGLMKEAGFLAKSN